MAAVMVVYLVQRCAQRDSGQHVGPLLGDFTQGNVFLAVGHVEGAIGPGLDVGA